MLVRKALPTSAFNGTVAARLHIRRSTSRLWVRTPTLHLFQQRCDFHIFPPAKEEAVPLRKQLKDEAKKKKKTTKTIGKGKQEARTAADARLAEWELTVGIEIHAELNTAHKLFSSAATSSNAEPNSHVALFDAAIPGAQPQFQKATLIPALRAALALKCQIQRRSSWDRKHYFYQDQPNGYQITQYYEPFARDGSLTLFLSDGIDPADATASSDSTTETSEHPSFVDQGVKTELVSESLDDYGIKIKNDEPSLTIGIKQIQMEQDTAKTTHQLPSTYLLDFNRVSHPLIEIITLPQIHSPATAAAVVRKIQSLLRSVDACVAGMEAGGLRADVNVSVRRRNEEGENSYAGVKGLGTRTEIKNLSSLKAVEEAVAAERDRQIAVLEAGGVIEGETRGWTIGSTETTRLRSKEGEVDYRYMPDPDLPPVLVSRELVERVGDDMPMASEHLVQMVMKDFLLSAKDAKTLVQLDDGDRLDYTFGAVYEPTNIGTDTYTWGDPKRGKLTANWVLHELGGLLASDNRDWADLPVSAKQLGAILKPLYHKQITARVAKQLLQTIYSGEHEGKDVETLIEEGNLRLRPLSEEEYVKLAQDIMDENQAMVSAIKDKGQKGKAMWFVGQMVRRGEEGTVEADKARDVVQKLLGI